MSMWLKPLAYAGAAGLALAAGAAGAQSVDQLPESLRALYTPAIEVTASAYDNFTPHEKPWKWCHSESYMGNPWRVTMNAELERLVDQAIAAGYVSDFEMSDSNGDVTQQIAQIRAFIDKGCDVITTILGSSTALNDAIDAAYDAGIVFVTTAGAATTPKAFNIQHNHNLWGYQMGKGIGERLPEGAGNVVMVEGISGHPLVVQENDGGLEAFAEYPSLEMLRTISGAWTANVTKSAVLQLLATTPQEIDAVWTTGSETRVVAEAFTEAGRPMPLITGTASGDALGYWKEHPDEFNFYGGSVLPTIAAQNAFRAGMRLLLGQKPVVNTIIVPVPEVKKEDLGQWAAPCMTTETGSIFPVSPVEPLTEEQMNGYFKDGTAIPVYDYATTPQPCG